MSVKKVKQYLTQFNAAERIIEFDHSSATVELAAIRVGCEPARIAKSMAFCLAGQAIVVVAAGDVKIDNAKFKAQFGVKAKMLAADDMITKVGFAVGAVSPFALNDGVIIYLDNSLKRFESVFPSGGSANSAIEVTIAELEEFSRIAGWVDVTKVKEETS